MKSLHKGVDISQHKWTSREIQTLIRGVFRYGENEWQELLLDAGEDEQAYFAGGFSFHPSRTAN